MRKFKKGDIIKLICADHMGAKIGALATCMGYKNNYIIVKWKRNSLSGPQCDGGYDDWIFELVGKKSIKPYGIATWLQTMEGRRI